MMPELDFASGRRLSRSASAGTTDSSARRRSCASSWKDFLKALKDGGLKGVEFIVPDDHPGPQEGGCREHAEYVARMEDVLDLYADARSDLVAGIGAIQCVERSS
jgi:cytosine/adenosine deaminase-related metal-dependent hydrolase